MLSLKWSCSAVAPCSNKQKKNFLSFQETCKKVLLLTFNKKSYRLCMTLKNKDYHRDTLNRQ